MKIERADSETTDEWGTPQWLFDVLNDEFHFRLDVCARAKNAKCRYYYNKRDDGLIQPWSSYKGSFASGGNFFCNPPYSDQLPWVVKARAEVRATATAKRMAIEGVGLYKHDPSTKHGNFIAEFADELRIIEHRIAYQGAPNVANFPSSIAVWRRRLYTRKSGARILYVNYRDLISQ